MRGDVLGGIAERRVGDDCDFSDLPVVIPDELEVANGRCRICPTGKMRYFQKQAIESAGSFDERIHFPGKSLEIISPQWTRRSNVEHGAGFVECEFNHLFLSS